MQPMLARRELDDTGTMDNWLALAAAVIAGLSTSEACMRIQGVESIKTDPDNPEESQRRRTNSYYHRHKQEISIKMKRLYQKKKAAARETAALHEGNNIKLSTLSVTNVLHECQVKEGKSMYKKCPRCGASLDPEERCDCNTTVTNTESASTRAPDKSPDKPDK